MPKGGARKGSGKHSAIPRTPRQSKFQVRCTPEEKTSLEEFWAELKVKAEKGESTK